LFSFIIFLSDSRSIQIRCAFHTELLSNNGDSDSVRVKKLVFCKNSLQDAYIFYLQAYFSLRHVRPANTFTQARRRKIISKFLTLQNQTVFYRAGRWHSLCY